MRNVLNIFCIPAADENGADDTAGKKLGCFPCRVRDWKTFFDPTLIKWELSLVLVCRSAIAEKPKETTGRPPLG